MNVFDIVGPVMIGPSSSHTAGAARIGKAARLLLGEEPAAASILFHGSFAKTYRGHGTDKAIIGGLLGFDPWDGRIRDSQTLAQKAGIQIQITTGTIDDAHPNTALITMTGKSGKSVSLQGASVGGGNIQITRINGMDVNFSGQYPTLIVLHHDQPGVIAQVTAFVSQHRANIANFRLNRQEKGGLAIMTIEMDQTMDEASAEEIKAMPHVEDVILFKLN
ncbi:MAG: L-serine ammonia-lyase, iron-sulfur-dependent subunit beta [Lachnospiraceae bacterium]|nr:L-serine ammonia-lyase, iron-sulfur-dependent subunit beta [Lachnospiraceae bacterium]